MVYIFIWLSKSSQSSAPAPSYPQDRLHTRTSRQKMTPRAPESWQRTPDRMMSRADTNHRSRRRQAERPEYYKSLGHFAVRPVVPEYNRRRLLCRSWTQFQDTPQNSLTACGGWCWISGWRWNSACRCYLGGTCWSWLYGISTNWLSCGGSWHSGISPIGLITLGGNNKDSQA